MRLAALYDIHGNLPALEAVLEDVRRAEVDQIVVGGDVIPGPMPREALRLLMDLELPTHFIFGNGELAMLAQVQGSRGKPVTYWGTTSGARPPQSILEVYRWTAGQLSTDLEALLVRWPMTVQLEIAGLGKALFCHSTPRSETEAFTRRTAVEHLLPIVEPLQVDILVSGHTHMQFDRSIGNTRVVNAGSVGAPFGDPGAYWLLLGPDVQLRRTAYDFIAAARRVRETDYPDAERFATQSILTPPSEQSMLDLFAQFELRP
jgi:predicted phosphodiesterase